MERPIAVVIDLAGVKDGGGWAAVLCVGPVDLIFIGRGGGETNPHNTKGKGGSELPHFRPRPIGPVAAVNNTI